MLLLAYSLLLCQSSTPEADRAEFAVVVHPDNTTESLTLSRLRRIFKAEIQEWPSHKAVQLLLPRSGTDEKQVLLKHVYGMTDRQLKRYWTRLIYENRIVQAPRSLPSSAVALRTLERSSRGITVVPERMAARAERAKLMELDGKRPGDTGYPLWLSREGFTRSAAGPHDRPGALEAGAREATGGSQARREAPQDDAELEDRLTAVEDALASKRSDRPTLNAQIFGHVEAEYQDERVGGVSSTGSTFSIESLDLLLTSALSERVSALVETVIETQDDNSFEVEVERLLLKYRFSDACGERSGGAVPDADRPLELEVPPRRVAADEHRPARDPELRGGRRPASHPQRRHRPLGRLLREHTGVRLCRGAGQRPRSDAGRDPVEGRWERCEGVQPLGRIGAGELARLGGWEAVFISDDIPPNGDVDAGPVHGRVDEVIYNVFCTYEDSIWEAMGENFLVDHEQSGATAQSSGWYVQVGRHFEAWTPYVRVDGVEREDLDPYFDTLEDSFTVAAGLRYDLTPWAALTLQYERSDIDPPPGDPGETTDTVVLQASFVF